ncbi:HpcH/HpaI aldolase/citrate lyase family protein [Herbaspirillum sp. RTI4]|uniref:HpcH/HpaI aldolase family protein n=1 Tax=Herbaspirillum sp. RTI4 TaxID=3048640 RepID=UPI002AB4910A|nr:HpcH/HpaI aldolase/citrate lyase family protein [Herbaspirillum sp. RTI4]MDY7579268.1 HpcH/HpaI aldolase/citrate lyase family protein [Herbaspirillum sp. RTI4]MEA9982767.1 HpcH/HpaI aldolase/citrate lyase family protein [Herbaspirillum sp. RTI4]
MDMPRNTFKKNLQQAQFQAGLFLGLGSPLSAEILASCGYDFLLIDAEHAPNDVRSVQAQLQAMAAYPVQCLVRPPNHDASLIKQLLAAGVQTLLVPMVDTAEQAAALVSAMRYPPKGIRGVGTALERSARWNAVPTYFAEVEDNTCLIVQIESRIGLDNLEEIAKVDGVDGIFIGPADLAASLGYLGQPGHPEVKAAIEQAIDRIVASGKAAGVFSTAPELAKAYRARGACFLALGADTSVLRSAAISLLNTAKPAAGATGAAY